MGPFDVEGLSCGSSYYDGQDTLYYRGDGVNTSVRLPEGKVAERIHPAQHLDQDPDLPTDMLFFASAIPSGELVTITLEDAI